MQTPSHEDLYMYFGCSGEDEGSIRQSAQLAIESRKFKVSRFDRLNDPFECRIVAPVNSGLKEMFENMTRTVRETFGLLCFCKGKWSDPLMWSHYASKHEGICLRFSFDGFCDNIRAVTYSEELPVVPSSLLELTENLILVRGAIQDHGTHAVSEGLLNGLEYRATELLGPLTEQMLSRKHLSWKYENEVRMPISLKNTEGGYCDWIGDDGTGFVVREVILGARCSAKYSDVAAWCAQIDMPEVNRCHLHRRKYELLKKQESR
ncbi:DUF2971 domain-containing protein [bacterium]|nr:DUF2971 domain-containing protein [bacterium]